MCPGWRSIWGRCWGVTLLLLVLFFLPSGNPFPANRTSSTLKYNQKLKGHELTHMVQYFQSSLDRNLNLTDTYNKSEPENGISVNQTSTRSLNQGIFEKTRLMRYKRHTRKAQFKIPDINKFPKPTHFPSTEEQSLYRRLRRFQQISDSSQEAKNYLSHLPKLPPSNYSPYLYHSIFHSIDNPVTPETHLQEEDDSQRSPRSALGNSTRAFHDHHKSRFQLYSASSWHLLKLLPNGSVSLTADQNDPYSFVEIEPLYRQQPYTVRFRSMATGTYLCMNNKGRLFTSCLRSSECEFLSQMEKTYYTSLRSKQYASRYLKISSNKGIIRSKKQRRKPLTEDNYFLEFKRPQESAESILKKVLSSADLLQLCNGYNPSFLGWRNILLPNSNGSITTEISLGNLRPTSTSSLKAKRKKCVTKKCRRRRRKCRTKRCRDKRRRRRKGKHRNREHVNKKNNKVLSKTLDDRISSSNIDNSNSVSRIVNIKPHDRFNNNNSGYEDTVNKMNTIKNQNNIQNHRTPNLTVSISWRTEIDSALSKDRNMATEVSRMPTRPKSHRTRHRHGLRPDRRRLSRRNNILQNSSRSTSNSKPASRNSYSNKQRKKSTSPIDHLNRQDGFKVKTQNDDRNAKFFSPSPPKNETQPISSRRNKTFRNPDSHTIGKKLGNQSRPLYNQIPSDPVLSKPFGKRPFRPTPPAYSYNLRFVRHRGNHFRRTRGRNPSIKISSLQ